MTRAQAVALSSALEANGVPHSIALKFPSPGVEAWNVQLDPSVVYTGAELAQLANYCQTNGLALTIQVQYVSVT